MRSRYFSFVWFFEQRSCFDVIDFKFKSCSVSCLRASLWLASPLVLLQLPKSVPNARTHTSRIENTISWSNSSAAAASLDTESCPEMPPRCARILWRANKVRRVPQLRTRRRQIYSVFHCFSMSSLFFWPLLVFAHRMHFDAGIDFPSNDEKSSAWETIR